MAMGKRDQDDQGNFWIPTSALPTAASHPFYEHVNRILDGKDFDGFVEDLCRKFITSGWVGRHWRRRCTFV